MARAACLSRRTVRSATPDRQRERESTERKREETDAGPVIRERESERGRLRRKAALEAGAAPRRRTVGM